MFSPELTLSPEEANYDDNNCAETDAHQDLMTSQPFTLNLTQSPDVDHDDPIVGDIQQIVLGNILNNDNVSNEGSGISSNAVQRGVFQQTSS